MLCLPAVRNELRNEIVSDWKSVVAPFSLSNEDPTSQPRTLAGPDEFVEFGCLGGVARHQVG